MNFIEKTPSGICLRIYATPRSSKTEIVGLHGSPPRLKIKIAAPPVDGAANEELLRFLSKTLGVSTQKLTLVRGESSKMKDVFCTGIDETAVKKLWSLLNP